MTLTVSSDARWGTAVPAVPARENAHPAPITPNAPSGPTDHRLRRRLGRKCASVLAGASMGLGLTAARIPAASAQVGIAQPVVDHPAADYPAVNYPAVNYPPGGQSP